MQARGLNWIIARPPTLNDDPATGHVRVFDAAAGEKSHKLARADLAAWLVAQLDDSAHVRRAVTVATS